MSKDKNLFKFNKKMKKKSIKSFTRTKYCRFKASDRLKFYSTISNWVFTLISLLLIIASLIDVYGIFKTSCFFTFYQTSLAVTILVFFQVISNADYELKSLRFHQCSIEISKILQKLDHIKIKKKLNKNSEDKIKQILNEYSSILKRYENHETLDFFEYKKHIIDEKNKKNKKNNLPICSTFNLSSKIFFKKYLVGLFPQIILTILSILGFYFSFKTFVLCS